MCVCVCVCVCMCVCVWTDEWTSACVSVRMRVCVRTYARACVYACTRACVYVQNTRISGDKKEEEVYSYIIQPRRRNRVR